MDLTAVWKKTVFQSVSICPRFYGPVPSYLELRVTHARCVVVETVKSSHAQLTMTSGIHTNPRGCIRKLFCLFVCF